MPLALIVIIAVVVLAYNNAIKTFPGNIVAGSKFQPRQGFLVTEESVRQAPSVKF